MHSHDLPAIETMEAGDQGSLKAELAGLDPQLVSVAYCLPTAGPCSLGTCSNLQSSIIYGVSCCPIPLQASVLTAIASAVAGVAVSG